jgi:hypothetical protein
MTRAELVQRAKRVALVGANGDESPVAIQDPEIDVLAEVVMHEFAQEVGREPDKYPWLQSSFSVTLTSGVGTIPATIDIDSLRWGYVVDGDGNVLSQVRYYPDLVASRKAEYGYYCTQKGQIHTKQAGTASLTATTTPLTVYANLNLTLATISSVPDALAEELVMDLAARIRRGAGLPAFTEAA